VRTILAAALAAAILAVTAASAFADEWVAVRLRGNVMQLIDGEWQKLKRNDIVPDSRVIRTMRTGNVEFSRGNETVTIGPDTQIQIFDESGSKPFTTVKQYFGTVTVQAEVRQVQHFAVQTPYLAAVVKGTRFTVTSGDSGANVEVKRGRVLVEDKGNNDAVTIVAGQSAGVEKGSSDVVIAGDPSSSNGASEVASDNAGKKDKNSNGNSGNAFGVTVNGGHGNGNGNNGNGNGNGGANVGVNVAGVSVGVTVGGGNSGSSGNSGSGGGGNSGSGGGSSGSGNSGNGNGNGGNLLNVTVGPLNLRL
jgi:hypothetical protein